MDLLGLLSVVVRRWRATVPVLVLAIVIAVYVETGAPEVYEASGSILVSEPQIDPETDPVILTVPPTIAREVRLSEEASDVAQAAGVTNLSVDAVDDQHLQISVTGSPASVVEDAATRLADRTTQLVTEIQDDAGVPGPDQIRALTLSVDVMTAAEEAVGATAVADIVLEDPRANVENPFAPDPATGRLLQVSTLSDAGREMIDARTNGEIEFELEQDPQDRAPILQVYVIAQSEPAALNGFREIVDVVAADLDERQARAGVRTNDRLVIEVLAAPQRARNVSPPISRAVAVIVALGLLLALAVAMLADSLARRDIHPFVRGEGTKDVWLSGRLDSADSAASEWPRVRNREPRDSEERGTQVRPPRG